MGSIGHVRALVTCVPVRLYLLALRGACTVGLHVRVPALPDNVAVVLNRTVDNSCAVAPLPAAAIVAAPCAASIVAAPCAWAQVVRSRWLHKAVPKTLLLTLATWLC